MILGLRNSPYASYRIFIKDVRADYSKSMFGIIWDMADPLVLGIVFYFLARARIINTGEISIPYPTFVIYGLLLYQTFSDSILLPMNVMARSRNILTHLKLPPEALIMSVLYRILFNSIFRITAMLVFSIATGAISPIGFVKFLLLYPGIILSGMAFGVFLAPFNAIYNDIGKIARLVLLPLRYASPVMYAIPDVAPFTYIHGINPVALILDDLRLVATQNILLDVPELVTRLAVFAIMLLIGWFTFHVSVPIIAEKV